MSNEKSNFEQQMSQLGKEIEVGFEQLGKKVTDYANSEQGQRLKDHGKDFLKNSENAMNTMTEELEKGTNELFGRKNGGK